MIALIRVAVDVDRRVSEGAGQWDRSMEDEAKDSA